MAIDLDELMDESARARRRRMVSAIFMLAGDFVGSLAVALGYIGFFDWIVAAPIIALAWGYSGYVLWRIFLKPREDTVEKS